MVSSFINAKDEWLDEAGGDLAALKSLLADKSDVEDWLSYLKS